MLIAPRVGGSGETPTSLQAMLNTMDMIARAGFDLIGVIDPKDHLDALAMVMNGTADIVVASRPDHLPAVRVVTDEAWFEHRERTHRTGTAQDPPRGVHRRTQRRLRPEDADWRGPGPAEPGERPVPLDHRRPRIIERGDASDGEPGIPRQRRTQIIRRGDAEVELDDQGRTLDHRRPQRIPRSA